MCDQHVCIRSPRTSAHCNLQTLTMKSTLLIYRLPPLPPTSPTLDDSMTRSPQGTIFLIFEALYDFGSSFLELRVSVFVIWGCSGSPRKPPEHPWLDFHRFLAGFMWLFGMCFGALGSFFKGLRQLNSSIAFQVAYHNASRWKLC